MLNPAKEVFRPLSVTIILILDALEGTTLLFLGLVAIGQASHTFGSVQLELPYIVSYYSFQIVFGILCLCAAYGYYRRSHLAWITGLILTVFGIIIGLLLFLRFLYFSYFPWAFYILPINVLILLYLMKPSTRMFFRKVNSMDKKKKIPNK